MTFIKTFKKMLKLVVDTCNVDTSNDELDRPLPK